MAPEVMAPAQAAIARAEAAKDGATEVERGLIDALALRYDADESDATARETAWADALGELARAHPEDADLWTLHAEALMNLQPWDYWQADATTPKGRAGEIVAALERALELDPDHLGAMHLYIHAVEASSTPERAEPYADRLRGAAPALGHLVHMPGHIYLRVGRYEDALDVNRDAVAADEALIAQMGDAATPTYAYGYYPHNIHFMLVSAQMIGAGDDAIEAAEKLAAAMSDDVAKEVAIVQAMKTAVYAMHPLYSPPETVLALSEPGEDFPYVRGFRHYARGLAHVAEDDLDVARDEADAIADIASRADMSALEAQRLPAPLVLGLAERVVRARIASAEGDLTRAETLLREAAEMQDQIPYMEPPYWHYPVRQSLAAVLLEQDRPDDAVAMFERALEEQPRSAWTLSGLAAARRAAGDAEGAEAAEARIAAVWRGDPALLAVERL